MASMMGAVIILWMLLATAVAFDVNITGGWKPDLGWEVTCVWETQVDDALQSVRLYNNGQQFLIYRPEIHGPARSGMFRSLDKVLNVDCSITANKGRKGKCSIILEPFQPQDEDFTYTCEVSGERPMFRISKKDYLVRILVPPSDAELVSIVQEQSSANLVALNCSSSGLPAPTLKWMVGNEKIPEMFSGRAWNATSKLWHVWSYFTYTQDSNAIVSCTPEVTYNNDTIMATAAMFNSAVRLYCGIFSIMVFISFSLIR